MTAVRPPGPRGHPLLGHVRAVEADPLGTYAALAREWGDVVRIRFLLWPTYLLFHPDHVRHVLQDRHRAYDKDLYTYRMLRPVLGSGLVTSSGPSWLRQRRLVQPAFHRQRLAPLADLVNERADLMLDRWQAAGRRGEAVDVSADLVALTLQVAGLALFGVDLTGDAAAIGRAFGDANRLLASYVHNPLPPLAVPTRRNRRLRAARDRLHRFVDELVARRRREGGDRGDLLSMLLQARDEESGLGMDDAQVRDEVLTLLVAGHETTASALGWACHLLARHPEAEAKLGAELAAGLGDRPPRLDQLAGLPYLRMVLDETLRLYPPGWSFGRRAVEDDEIGGWRIPAGSIVWLCPYVTHRHPLFWERPEEFDPERFRSGAGADRHRFAYFPFAAGPRMCAGRDFALLEASLVLAAIVQRCRLRPIGDAPVEPRAELTLRPPDGLRMLPLPRAG